MNLDDLAGLIGEQNVKPEAVQDEPEAGWAPPPLVPGSVAAAVVADVYGGAAVTIVKSPPGGGKTHLLGILTDGPWVGTAVRRAAHRRGVPAAVR